VTPVALDEATTRLLEQLAASGARPLAELTPREAREQMAAMRAGAEPGPEVAAVRGTRVRVTGGFVPLRILTPAGQPRGIIVYYHGGGWVLGDLDGIDRVGRVLAQRTGCTVVLVDYRLAPEYRFPVAVDDSWAALRWADQRRGELAAAAFADAAPDGTGRAGTGIPLIVAGDSAGGNLAAVLAVRARAEGGPAIALQVLVYPATDTDLDSTSYRDPANQLLLSRDSAAWFYDHYVPDPGARLHPDAAPLRNTNLSRLPPAVVLTAEHDVLRDEGELYATRMLKSGVPVRHRRFDGQMHGFFTMLGVLPGAAAAMDYVVAAVDETLAGQPARATALS
jgi:acetyl esterase